MKRVLPPVAAIVATTVAALLAAPALAAPSHEHMEGMSHDAPMTMSPAAGHGMENTMSEGTVKKVDKDAGRLTIAHGPLANLGMPAMTMAFRVKDPAMLDQVKAGDKIRFTAQREHGAFMIVALEPAS